MKISRGVSRHLPKIAPELHSSLTKIQESILTLKELPYVPVGPEYKTMDPALVERNLVRSRLAKKLERPDSARESLLHSLAIEAMLDDDATRGFTSWQPSQIDMDPFTRQVIYTARNILNEVFSSFRVDYRNLAIPNGEIYTSTGGRVSIYSKLSNKDNIEVTWDCFDDLAKLCYNHRMLKLVMKAHMGPVTRDKIRSLWLKHNHATDCGFRIFRERLLREVVTIVEGSRVISIPKNNDERRVINIEPLGNIIVQRAIALTIKGRLKKRFLKDGSENPLHLDIERGQDYHREMLSDPHNATIDLRHGSNSTFLKVSQWMLPVKLFSCLERARSPLMVMPDGDSKEYYPPKMLSMMGNGFTFEIMSITLLSICRSVDSGSMVFGDDIIVDNDCTPVVCDALGVLGYLLNEKKTFINSPFRESCGGFYHDALGYLQSFDMLYPETLFDATTCLNKIFTLLKSGYCDDVVKKVWSSAIGFAPAYAIGPRTNFTSYSYEVKYHKYDTNRTEKGVPHFELVKSSNDELSGYFYADMKYVLKRRKSCSKTVELHKKELLLEHSWNSNTTFHNFVTIVRKSLINSELRDDNVDVFNYAARMFTGSAPQDLLSKTYDKLVLSAFDEQGLI